MINIIDKKDCVGCNACVQRCPKQCISMHEDEQGFLYPKVDLTLCIHCDLCEKVCPVINEQQSFKPLKCYASKSVCLDTLQKSSSGGIFGLIAENILEKGGIVFGAAFGSDISVVHRSIDNKIDLPKIQRSKYSQSIIGTTYQEAEEKLKAGKLVLYSGTPCQILGLRLFLKKEYTNLITIDIACHSVPSPKIWKAYLETQKHLNFNKVNFRNKKNGWLNYGFSLNRGNEEVFYQKTSENVFMRGFLNDLYSRPSCSRCPAKEGRSGSDLTLADFWGIEKILPDFNARNGASAVMLNTPKGLSIFEKIISSTESQPVYYEDIICGNPALVKSAVFPRQRNDFWTRYPIEGICCIRSITDSMRPSFVKLGIHYILRKFKIK